MTIRELIAALSQFDPETPVYVEDMTPAVDEYKGVKRPAYVGINGDLSQPTLSDAIEKEKM